MRRVFRYVRIDARLRRFAVGMRREAKKKRYGVEALTIGSNDANYPPQVPKLHVWRDEQSDTDVIVVYHPYGYAGYGP